MVCHPDVVRVDLQQQAKVVVVGAWIVLDGIGMSEHAVDRRFFVVLERIEVGGSLLIWEAEAIQLR